jgi:hypothetical protein
MASSCAFAMHLELCEVTALLCDRPGRAGARNIQFELVHEPPARVVSLLGVEARDTLESARNCGA